jgi:hypothetical protein
MKVTGLYKLCSPAKFYLVISVITMLVMLYQNSSFNDIFCLGTFGCESENKPYLFLNAVYVIFWTWILNVLCVNNYTMLSWGCDCAVRYVFVLSASVFRIV